MTLGNTLGNVQALVNTETETVQETEELSVGDTPGGPQPMVDARANTQAEVKAVPPGDKLDDAHALNDLLRDTWRHTKQCAVTGGHAG